MGGSMEAGVVEVVVVVVVAVMRKVDIFDGLVDFGGFILKVILSDSTGPQSTETTLWALLERAEK